jgi:hypothetical protein
MEMYFSDESEEDPESMEIDYPDTQWYSESDEEYVEPPRSVDYMRMQYLLQKYSKDSPIIPPLSRTVHPKALNTGDTCCICFESMQVNNTCFCSKQCGTIFHVKCIREYNRIQCPFCRTSTIYTKMKTYKRNA